MQQDIISRIRQAEKEAADLREQGQAQAREELRHVAEELAERKQNATRQLHQEVKDMQAKAADAAASQARQEVTLHAATLKQADEAQLARERRAVDFVLERIVRG